MNNNRSDVFRFMAIREPNKLINIDSARIKANEEGEENSILLKTFNDSLQSETPSKAIEKIATDYVNNKLNGATTYTTSLKSIDPKLLELDTKIHGNPKDRTVSFIKKEIERLNITDENLVDWKKRIGDSFNATLVLRKNRGAELRSIERAIRTLHVISQVKNDAISHDKGIKSALTKTITVSKSISPKTSSKEVKQTDDENSEQIRKNAELVKKSIEEYKGNQSAIKELLLAYDKDWEIRRLQDSEVDTFVTKAREIPAVYSGVVQKFGKWLGVLPISEKINIPESTTHKHQAFLSKEIAENISKETKGRLTAIGSNPEKIEASFAVMRLEEKNKEIANVIYFDPSDGTIANRFGRIDVEAPESGGVYVDDTEISHKPGECLFHKTNSPIVDDIFPDKKGRFLTLDVGDLQIVKQKLIGYEIGEIAHIENVMASEKRLRNHRTLHRTEEFTSFELEKEEETERDLETTTRFELQKEIDEEVQENSQKEAGVTVSGSYGPTVEFTANAGIATENSSSKSNSLSTSYSKDVVGRSVQRIQEKIKEKRTLLTIDEVEVINKHSFKNQDKEAVHINGIYHWVNKKYEAQLFNYGKRGLIEVVIPEPAAFVRYLATSHPKEGSTIPKPPKPGYCINGKFIPLSIKTLSETNYLDWVTAYNLQDIETPPQTFLLLSTSLRSETNTEFEFSETTETVSTFAQDLPIPPGYQAVEAWFCINLLSTTLTLDDKQMINRGDVTIGRTTTFITTTNPINPRHVDINREEGNLAIAVSTISTFPLNMTLEVKCKQTNKALTTWKISTFNTIVNKYEILKEEYEESISGEELFGSVDIQGKNPLENKTLILNELKRQVITQMTGQTFEGFDAMREKVPPLGFPEQDVDEAWSEGQYVRFVEQAFEWENMQYLFYPYFWGKKKDWPINSRLEDTDPLFQSFLQAGYCRLNIPVRPGFECSVVTFLSIGENPWTSLDNCTVVPSDNLEEEDPSLSIAEELKAQQGAVYFKSDGTVSHVNGDADTVLTGNIVEEENENGEIVQTSGTNFVEDDVNREINIKGKIYMIISVDEEHQKITLDEDIAQSIEGDVQYGISAKAIGVPWVVTIPTSLVILGDGSDLPEIPE